MRRCKLKREYDLAVVGAGFGGSLMAMIANRLGLSVILLERGKHPRVVIGESTTPLSNLVLERLSATYDLPRIGPLAKWGSWQRAYPQIACGLKRGFSFFHQGSADHQSFNTAGNPTSWCAARTCAIGAMHIRAGAGFF